MSLSTTPCQPTSSGKAPIYYAVCRLFNRAYPAGSSGGAFAADWRVRFFGTTDDTKLFNSSGSLNPPGSSGLCSATQTYSAILSWIASSPAPLAQVSQSSASAEGTNAAVRTAANDRARQESRQAWIGIQSPLASAPLTNQAAVRVPRRFGC